MESIKAMGIRYIKQEIPRPILEATFIRRNLNNQFFSHVTLESAISSVILDSMVFLDLMLLTGRETTIELAGLPHERNSDGSCIIHVPTARLAGRNLLEVYRVNFNGISNSPNSLSSTENSELDRRVDQIIDGTNSIPVTSTSSCEIIAPNTILIREHYDVLEFINAVVNLSHDKEMSHIPPKAFHIFAELCVNKCKEYIYTQNIIRMDRGMVERGMEIGTFKSIIDEYRDSTQNYKDLLKQWRRVDFHLDHEKKEKLIRLITRPLG